MSPESLHTLLIHSRILGVFDLVDTLRQDGVLNQKLTTLALDTVEKLKVQLGEIKRPLPDDGLGLK